MPLSKFTVERPSCDSRRMNPLAAFVATNSPRGSPFGLTNTRYELVFERFRGCAADACEIKTSSDR
jgi:hypothetical protein